MADSPLITCANAIAYELNAAVAENTFNRQFEARVLWAKRTLKLPDLKVLHVDIAPISWTQVLIVRGGVFGHVLRYHVGVRKWFGDAAGESTGEIADSEVTDLVTLLKDLCGFFMPDQSEVGKEGSLSQFTTAVWQPEKKIDNLPATDVYISWDDLIDSSQFTGFFELTYEATV